MARRVKERGGESKGERQIQPVVSSLSVLHSPEHIKRFTELGREEKGEGGDRGDLVEKKESKEEESSLASNQIPMCSPQPGTPREVHGVTYRREEGGRG